MATLGTYLDLAKHFISSYFTKERKSALAFTILSSSTFYLLLKMVRYFRSRSKNVIIHDGSEKNMYIVNSISKHIHEYSPPPLLSSALLNTLVSSRRAPLNLKFERTIIQRDDGHYAVDWRSKLRNDDSPIYIILHGLTGGSGAHYVQYMVKALEDNSSTPLSVGVLVSRGCSGLKLSTPITVGASFTSDVTHFFENLRKDVGPTRPIFAIGYSLGAGILNKYLSDLGSSCPLSGAVSVCAAFRYRPSVECLENGAIGALYNRFLANHLKVYLREHLEMIKTYPGVNVDLALSATTMRQFDENTVAKIFGFKDAWDYYDAADIRLDKIRVPTLFLNAADDPICSIKGMPSVEDIKKNPNIIACVTPGGGHVGWCLPSQSFFQLHNGHTWENFVISDYFRALVGLINGSAVLEE